MSNQSMMSGLEPRMLLSGDHSGKTPKPAPDPVQLEAIRQEILADVATLKTNYDAAAAVLQAARQARHDHRVALEAQIDPMHTDYKMDVKARNAERKENDAARKAVRNEWKPVLTAGALDVATDTEGETPEERAADYSKLQADKAAYMTALQAVEAERRADELKWKTELRNDRNAIEAARDAAHDQRKADDRAVKVAERALKSVFQTDRRILEVDLKAYKRAGGDTRALELPALPKLKH